MTEPRRLVSVIIPVYNGERYLAEAVRSVLAQRYDPMEVIVVDDGSTDGTAAVARRFDLPVRRHFQSNSGAGAARNSGVQLSQGEILAFLDADDLWLPDKLALQMAALQADSSLDMVFGHMQQFHSPELSAERKAKLAGDRETMPGYHCGTLLIKRDSFLRVGPFSTERRVGEFIDWYARAMELELRHLMLPDVVTRRRLHDANMGIRERDSRSDYVRILKVSLDRRRKGGNPCPP